MPLPTTNSSSERSFSALRRVKTLLCCTTTQVRLKWCMLLYVHKNETDHLSLLRIANEFISRNDSRLRIFGLFILFYFVI